MTLGIYFHIPFCCAKCSYCHFISAPFSEVTAGLYQQAILKELGNCVEICSGKGEIDSIYFGGGTPSLIPADYIAGLINSCRRQLSVSEDCEISLEANPGTLSATKIEDYRRCGVNRISIGAQSFNDMELQSIGRLHTTDMIGEAVALLRTVGFENINLDLMLGLPGQTPESWNRNLEITAGLEVPHVSVYMLDLDDQCPLQSLVAAGSVRLPEEDLISDLYLETLEYMSRSGYGQYEISNFAREGNACRHNLKYWRREPVHGMGVGSHSFDGQSRYANCAGIDDYLERLSRGNSPVVWSEQLSIKQSLSESLFLGLRLTRGVDWELLGSVYGDPLAFYEPCVQELAERRLIERKDSIVRLTPSGMLLSNEVFQLFI